MDRDEFFAQLDQLTPKEIEARLPSWDKEKLVLVQEYFANRDRARAPQTDHLARGKSGMEHVVTERTIAAALIALGLVVAALILRGGYEVAGSSMGAYVVNRFTGATWQCLDTCIRLETVPREKK
jgi:hypothetical protein